MTLKEVVDAYLSRQRSLGMRFESAGQLLCRFSRVMGNPQIDEVTPEAVADFLRVMSRDLPRLHSHEILR